MGLERWRGVVRAILGVFHFCGDNTWGWNDEKEEGVQASGQACSQEKGHMKALRPRIAGTLEGQCVCSEAKRWRTAGEEMRGTRARC